MSGGELFTHLYQRDYFSEGHVQMYIAEVVVALENLHSVSMALWVVDRSQDECFIYQMSISLLAGHHLPGH